MRVTLGVLQTNLLLVLFFALVLNWPILLHFYSVLSELSHVKAGFAISIPLVLIAALNAVFIPFTFRFVLKPFFTVLILSGSIVSYAMLKYGVIFDAGMMQNIVETNSGEAGAYLNCSVALWFLLTGLLPTLMLWSLRIRYPARWYHGLALRTGALVLSLLFIGGGSRLFTIRITPRSVATTSRWPKRLCPPTMCTASTNMDGMCCLPRRSPTSTWGPMPGW